MKKICIFVGSRANYSSIKSVMRAVKNHPDLQLQLIVGAAAVLDRYGSAANLIKADGFIPDAEIFMLLEGETPSTMAKSTGLGLIELSSHFERLKPDIVVTVGDRFETMATTLAAAYMNIPIAHTMGGEVSGTIDESIRHAVTKFAHLHFPSSKDAAERIRKLGEREDMIFMVGCPRIDLIADVLKDGNINITSELFKMGVGNSFDLEKPFAIVLQHPVTTEYGQGEKEVTAILEAVEEIDIPAIVLWPNADAGSDDIARGIRKWREQGKDLKMHFFKNLPTEVYISLLKKTAVLVGNSSSGIRDSAYIGTPVVNVGTRQTGRERGENVIDATGDKSSIATAVRKQIAHGRYKEDTVYGDGRAGEKIADILAEISEIQVQKIIQY